MKEYLNNKLSELKNRYNAESFLKTFCATDLKRQWEKDYKEVKNLWATIVNMDDVQKYIDAYDVVVNRYLKTNSGIDTYYVNLILFKATYAIDKMVNCYDNNKCDFHFSNTTDIDSWFEKLYKLIDIMNNELNRRAMAD